jgi:hypothetical protein
VKRHRQFDPISDFEPPIIVDEYFSFADDAPGRHKAFCLGLSE